MFGKSDFTNVDDRLQKMTSQPVEQIEIDSDLPPTINELEDNNKTYVIQAAILFIDIRKSTYLTENSQAKSMVKVYRSFMRMAVDCVRKNGGVTRQFLGDRIMGVFMDTTDQQGNVQEKATDKAVDCARSLQTVIDYSLNKHLKNNVNGKVIECGIGIDYGKILVTKVGMYGVEADESKQDETDCVWVGNVTNHASKYSDLAGGGEIFISDSVYKALSDNLKSSDVWQQSAKCKGSKLFEGYIAENYYLDFAQELGNPVRVEQDISVSRDTSVQLAAGIQAINKLQKDLQQNVESLAKQLEANKQKNSSITNYGTRVIDKIKDFLSRISHNSKGINRQAVSFYIGIINAYYDLGEVIGKSKMSLREDISHDLIDIYEALEMYQEAYEEMLFMAEYCSWVHVPFASKTLVWAKNNNKIGRLSFEMEWRLKQEPDEIDAPYVQDRLERVKEVEEGK